MHSKHEEMSQILFLDVNFRFQLYPVQIDEFRIDAQLTDQNYFPRLIAQYVNGGTGTLWPIIGVELNAEFAESDSNRLSDFEPYKQKD